MIADLSPVLLSGNSESNTGLWGVSAMTSGAGQAAALPGGTHVPPG